jgi:prevent-host-death family protein
MIERLSPMTRTISATDARVHFGEVLRGVSEDRATYYVERSGTPVAVVIAVEEYEALRQQQQGEYVRPAWLEDVIQAGQEFAASRVGQPPIDWQKMLDESREERDAQLLDGLFGCESDREDVRS